MLAESTTSKLSRAGIWKERLLSFKDGAFGGNGTETKRILRKACYRLFKPVFKEYYTYQAKLKARGVDWKNVYCGEKRGLVSVVLPVYNQANLLEESIKSVLNQEYYDFELIIVNDGSTDGVEGILDKYGRHPKIDILTQDNQGLPSALNTGFSRAEGEFLTWTSADNLMMPFQLKDQVGYLRKNDFAQMVFCNYELIDELGRPFLDPALTAPGTNMVNTDQDVRSLDYTYNFINACFLYRNYAGRFVGAYDPDMYGAEDYDYWMRFNHHFCIQHMGSQRPYYRYRRHGNTILGREGGAVIEKVIRKAQELNSCRRSFFDLPLTVYLPESPKLTRNAREQKRGRLHSKIVTFQGSQMLEALLSDADRERKTVLLLTGDQINDPKYLSILEKYSSSKLLFSFARLDDISTKEQERNLELFDWIIVETQAAYECLSDTYKDRLVCVAGWHRFLELFRIIADHHLFYKHIGRTATRKVAQHGG